MSCSRPAVKKTQLELPERDVRESLVFGHGAHFCLDADLAKQEMGAMLDEALEILTPGFRVRIDLQDLRQRGMFQRPASRPVEIAG